MPAINYLVSGGSTITIEAAVGSSVMETAVRDGVPGIVAECGGAGACATCHVYVDQAFTALVGPPDDLEDDLLDGTASERRASSRLSCQIEITAELDGLIVEIAPDQL